MNEAQVRTLEQVREVLAGTHLLEMRPVSYEAGRYGQSRMAARQRPIQRRDRARLAMCGTSAHARETITQI